MSSEEFNSNFFNDLCRICMKNNNTLISLYDLTIPETNEIRMIDFIRKITTLKISNSDGLPGTICTHCTESLINAYSLIEMCLQSQQKLKAIQNNIQKIKITDENSCELDGNIILIESEESAELNLSNNIKFDCNKCLKSFKSKTGLEKHLKLHETSQLLKCNKCNKGFNKLVQLSNHMRVHIKTNEKDFQCDICGKKFSYAYLLKQHKFKHNDKKPYPCTKCDKGCITKESLRRHMVIHNENYTKRKHKCNICDKEFAYPSFLAEHMKNHTGEKPFLCSICGKGFRQSGALAYHLRSHSGTKLFECNICNNYFMSAGTLRVHMRRHTNERPYVCDICGMAFRQSTDMKSHRRNHLGEKRVLCFICGKNLSTTGQLTVHMRSHTGEKPYKCQTCTKAFSTRTMLVKHTRIHTGERPYVCNFCNKSFNQRSTLKTHFNTHKDNVNKNNQDNKIIIEGYVDSNCIIVDQEVGAQYTIETVKNNLDSSKSQVNVVVLPAPVPLISNL